MSAKIKNITLELSGKAFTDDSQFTMYNVCRKMFTQWKLLTDRVATPFVINSLVFDFFQESFREFITFFRISTELHTVRAPTPMSWGIHSRQSAPYA